MISTWWIAWLLLTVATGQDDAMRDLTEDLAKEAEIQSEAMPEPVALPEGNGNDCFNRGSISNFEVLDRTNLVVFAPSKRHPYWVRIACFCSELRYSNALGFESRDSRICPYGGDSIIAGEDECSILSIHRLDEMSYVALKQQIAAKRAARGKRR